MQAPIEDIVPLEKRDKADLLRYIEGLDALLSTNYIISSAFDLDTVFRVITSQACQFLQAEASAIYTLDTNNNNLELVFSTQPDTPEIISTHTNGILANAVKKGRPVNLSDVADEPNYDPLSDNIGLNEIRSLFVVPLMDADELFGIALLANKETGNYFNREDGALFESYAGQVSHALRNYDKIQQEMEQQKLEREIEFCAKIQRRILPKHVPELPDYGVSGSTFPCRKVGGDWFNFIERPNGEVDFIIADVSGKGIAAALIVAMAHSALKVITKDDKPVQEIVADLNAFICDSIEFGQFITLFYGRLEPSTGRFTYCNAGHDAPFYFETGSREPQMLSSTGKIIGIDADAEYHSHEIILAEGSTLIMLTDGFLEAGNPNNDFFGDVFIEKIRPETFGKRVKGIRRTIYSELTLFTGNTELKDDATLIVITRPSAN